MQINQERVNRNKVIAKEAIFKINEILKEYKGRFEISEWICIEIDECYFNLESQETGELLFTQPD